MNFVQALKKETIKCYTKMYHGVNKTRVTRAFASALHNLAALFVKYRRNRQDVRRIGRNFS